MDAETVADATIVTLVIVLLLIIFCAAIVFFIIKRKKDYDVTGIPKRKEERDDLEGSTTPKTAEPQNYTYEPQSKPQDQNDPGEK